MADLFGQLMGLFIGGVIPLLILLFVAWYGSKCAVLIRNNEVGIVIRKIGPALPEGQIIARNNEVGVQAKTLMPGLHFRLYPFYEIKKDKVTIVEANQINLVESVDGEALEPGRLLGNEVECDNFQDAKKFLENHGKKGPQIGILLPGTYRINRYVFKMTPADRTVIPEKKIGEVITHDGKPLPKEYMIAPKPSEDVDVISHNYFQNGQAFINNGGYRGPQLDTLQPGNYYINTLLFEIIPEDVSEVKPGWVAVLRSNVGTQLATTPDKGPSQPPVVIDLNQPLHEIEEVVLITEPTSRGILRDPVGPGIYNLNKLAMTPYDVSTSALTVDWGEIHIDNGPARRSVGNEELSGKSAEFFRFSQLKVTSKDGFVMSVNVRLIIRVSPKNAPYVIARFGSIDNLIQQIVHPLIDSEFRNSAGDQKAIEFVHSRDKVQASAYEKAVKVFGKFHVETQNLLIGFIDVPEELLATQTNREIALQKIEQYQQEANAETMRKQVEQNKAIADKQPDVIRAQLGIKIAQDNAQAKIEEGKGIAYYSEVTGQGAAKGIEYLTNTIGADNAARLQIMDRVKEGKIKITPDILINGSGAEGNAGNLIAAWFANNLHEGKFERREIPSIPKPEGSTDKQPTAETTTETTIKTTTVQTETKTDIQKPASTTQEPVMDSGKGLAEAIKPYGEAAKEGEKKRVEKKADTQDY